MPNAVKLNFDGPLTHFKAWLLAKGYSQVYGTNYRGMFSTVVFTSNKIKPDQPTRTGLQGHNRSRQKSQYRKQRQIQQSMKFYDTNMWRETVHGFEFTAQALKAKWNQGVNEEYAQITESLLIKSLQNKPIKPYKELDKKEKTK